MHTLIREHADEIADLCRRYGVRRLEVFGSAARGDDFDLDSSDADFLVSFEPRPELPPLKQYLGFADALERVLGRPVDLLDRGSLEKSRNYLRRRSILEDAQPVYG